VVKSSNTDGLAAHQFTRAGLAVVVVAVVQRSNDCHQPECE
jgi:hypothetical protein